MDLQLHSAVLFSFFVFVFMVMKILLKRAKTSSSASKLPPGPWKLPFVGNIHQLFGSLVHRRLRDLAKKHGPFMYLRIGEVPTVIVSSPEFAKEVMRTHDVVFASRPRILFSEIMLYDCTDIGFAPYGEYWRQLRKICMQELLSTTRIQSFRPIREEEVFSCIEWISSNVGLTINLTERINMLMYSIISRATCGRRSKDNKDFISVLVEAVEVSLGFELADFFPSVSFFARISRSRPKLERLQQRAARIFEDIIHERKEKISAERSAESGTEKDLIDVLLKFLDNGDQGFSLTSDNLKAIIFDIFSAGIETSGAAVDWAMAEMIKNPRIMKKAQEEVREVFSRKGLVDETGLTKMKYLKSVVKETLRLHPPLPLLIPRESRDKCEINGYEIPAKTRIIVNAWAIGRDPRYWTEPESFIPERFVDSSIDFKGNNFEYIPFGAGRRICAGISFAHITVELPLALLLYYFDWKLPNGIKHEDLDMTEVFGASLKRKDALHLIPMAYNLSPIGISKRS
ncbi:Cytochrome P450, E-class, group I [Parasponia andersonii]|uniref:Cytochrome P450, E-class, group I n=1 Tax=Parasponia andersonii TaxID=3476 RepID=A0A2P5B3S4_PARAD|nr:Cytochrome P450, E-class, group I [Parasponia andersonii]